MLEIKETYLEVTDDREEKISCGDSGFYEPFTDDKGKLFKSLQKEFGKCVSKVYRDIYPVVLMMEKGRLIHKEEHTVIQVGWVFESRQKYDRSTETYIREVWVEYRIKIEDNNN